MIDGAEDRSVRAGDKLSYKNVLQDRVRRCLDAEGMMYYPERVQSLRSSCYFDISGLKFKSAIDEYELVLIDMYRKEVIQLITKDRSIWIHPIKKIYYETELNHKYSKMLFEFILNLLATHSALLEARDFVEKGERVD